MSGFISQLVIEKYSAVMYQQWLIHDDSCKKKAGCGVYGIFGIFYQKTHLSLFFKGSLLTAYLDLFKNEKAGSSRRGAVVNESD